MNCALKLGTWNVRTMTPGLSEDNQRVSDVRKTLVINNELGRLQVDIAALQETRLADTGKLREKDYTFFWQGKSVDQVREYGVGFAVKNSLLAMIEPGHNGNERLMTLRLHSSVGPVHLISAYAPTLNSPDDTKDEFYGMLEAIVRDIPEKDHLIILGDLNARVGADYESWPTCIGKYGVGKINANGQRALEFCTFNKLCITNTFFASKPQHKVSWRHPRSKHWHQLDLIITRRAAIKDVLQTRSFHSADCDTDHTLVCSKIKLIPKKVHRCKPAGKQKIDGSKTSIPAKAAEFVEAVAKALDSLPLTSNGTEYWNTLRDTVHSTAFQIFGRVGSQQNDWFIANYAILAPLLEEKRVALLAYDQCPSEKNLHALRSARNKVQATARRCANDYWLALCQSIQTSVDMGDIRGMYDGIKKALGPTQSKTAPLKTKTGVVIRDRGEQMERWKEHYSELYSSQTSVSESAIDAIDQLPLMAELDNHPTLRDLEEAVASLPVGKAPGMDGIPAEVIKCGKEILIPHLHNILCKCWDEGVIPQDMKDSKIVTLYKNKGDKSDCNNYRGISLLSIVGKLFARIILRRLQRLADQVYPESQCGFRAGRSTIDMIFSVRQLQEKCREQNKPLYMAFIDLTKAFDLVSRDGLFKILEKIGCPPKLLLLIRGFHDNMKGRVQYEGSVSDEFEIRSGVKQGCVLAPTLFGIFFAVMLKQAFGTATEGIYLRTRSDGRLFNLARLRAKSKVREAVIRELLFADDAALAAHSQDGLQSLMNSLSQACENFRLTISLKKTEVMSQNADPPHIVINDYKLEAVESFVYLGSTIANNLSLDAEINKRIGKASTVLARLTSRVWENRKLTINTKMSVFQACVLSTLLYSSESWTLYASQEKKLNVFFMRCLRRILGISWKDRITNNEVLARAKLPSMYTILRQRRLRWLGHVCRMEDGRIPKDILYGELSTGKRTVGRPHLRYKDVCKRDLNALGIDTNRWETIAADRQAWKRSVNEGLKSGEAKIRQQADEKRTKRKESQHRDQQNASLFICDSCNRDCHSRLGLYSHRRRCP